MIRQKRYLCKLFLLLLLFLFCFNFLNNTGEAKEKKLIVVIDPGHGGSDMGAITKGILEKKLNYHVATSMQRELMKYENVEVYLTREKDTDISLKDRAVFAKDKQADILISLHFNASESHSLSGAETYVSSKEPLKSKADKLANTELALLEQYGIPIHGNFTRLNDYGQDYYGIIRESAAFGIPAVIVEHCYLDVPNEEKFYDTSDDLERLGKIDATAVAMAYCLQSKILDVDYSQIKSNEYTLPESVYQNDITAPFVQCELKEYRKETGRALFEISVADDDSAVVGYAFSTDGGETFYTRKKIYFDEKIETTFIIKRPLEDSLVVKAYNAYDVAGYSKPLAINELIFPKESELIESIDFYPNIIEDVFEYVESDITDISGYTNPPEYIILFIISSICGVVFSVFWFLNQIKK